MSKEKTTLSDPDAGDKADWKEKVLAPYLEGEKERRGAFTTSSGVPLERVYTAEDWPA